MIKTSLPTWYDVNEKAIAGEKLTALEDFIFKNEPATKEQEVKFREGLLAALIEENLETWRKE